MRAVCAHSRTSCSAARHRAGLYAPLPTVHAPEHIVDDGERILIIGAASDGQSHLVIPVGSEHVDIERVEPHRLSPSIPNESIVGVAAAGAYVIIHGANKVADSIAIYHCRSFECVLRVVRDAIIPRFTAVTVVDQSLVVVDDRPGVMAARIDVLAKTAAAAGDREAGARAASALLRSSWCESPIGKVLELRAIPRSSDVVALVERDDVVSAALWTPVSSRSTQRRSYAGDRWS